MSNVDRYRPQREGYQPPSLPPKPPPTIASRLSKSPSRKRDIPPAVPSPPTHSSRTSPPRPHSRMSAPSPRQSSPPRLPTALPNQWYFTSDEIRSSPSILDGLSPAEERLRRTKGVNFIYQTGVLLDLPQITLYVAGVFFHRFYMRYSMVEEKGGIHHYNIAATAVFLANKTEENCRKTKDLIVAVAKVAQKNPKLIIDEQSKEYWRWRDSILTFEELMLEMLTFDLSVKDPYNRMFGFIQQLGRERYRKLRDAAWAFCNDSCLTTVPLLMNEDDIAAASIFFACTTMREKIDDVNGQPWWKSLKAREENIVKAIDVMLEFYKENPLKLRDPKAPGSPEFNLESTRRRGETVTSQPEGDSFSLGTPSGTDNGGGGGGGASQANGKPDHSSSTQGSNPSHGAVTATASKDAEGDQVMKTVEEEGGDQAEVKKESDEALKMEDVSQESRGDSDAALKAAANDLSLHEGKPNGDALLRSPPGVKRKSPMMDLDSAGEEPDRKKAKVTDEDVDEGEIDGP